MESDDRCASVLRTQFPRARLNRNLHALRQLPAETEVLAATLPWPEEEDDDAKARAAVEHPWLPASRAAATEEHAHFFRLLATRPVSWVVLELPVSLLRWATAAVPGTRPFGFLFSRADARVRLLRISRWTRERGDARARSPRRRVSRRTRPPLPARWAPADLAVPPTPLPSLLLSAARPPPIANVVKELETLNYRWAYRVVDLPGAYLFEATRRVAIEPTRRSRARDGDARLEPPRPSARAPLAAGFPPFFKRFLRRSRIEGPDRVGEDALGAGTETRDGL